MVVRGAMSSEDVRTYEGIVCSSYREACQARGLVGDDTEWVALFDEAVWATAYQLRNMFMAVVSYCDLGNVRVIFDTYILEVQTCKIDDLTLKNNLLKELSYMFCSNGLSLSTYDLPVPSDNSMIIP